MRTEPLHLALNGVMNHGVREALDQHYCKHFWSLLNALKLEGEKHSKGCECRVCTAISNAELVILPY